MFQTLSDRMAGALKNLRGAKRLTPEQVETVTREIRLALLEADVALPVVREFIKAVKERATGSEVSGALDPAQQVVKIVHDELVTILGGETRALRSTPGRPDVIMLVGLQGAGKTTLAGKLARWLKEQGRSPLLVAADLQRPNAVQQLSVVAERAGVAVFAPAPGNGVGDPVEVAAGALEAARTGGHDVVVVDTAGRLGIDEALMEQARAIKEAVRPDETLFVLDAMTGQDAVHTASAFNDGVGFDGVVLTKLDGDARGGAALSVRHLTGKAVMFASNGEKLEDFDVFHPDRMAGRILDMGDVLTLIEQAERTFDQDQAEKLAGKLGRGEGFTLEDFATQMEAMRRMGPFAKLLGMLPGMGEHREMIEAIDERELDRIQAIIRSMTPQERRDPKVLDRSRRRRVAAGSGVSPEVVDELLERFEQAQAMMTAMMNGGGAPQLPGMAGLPGMPGAGVQTARPASRNAPKRAKRPPKSHGKKKKRK